MVKVEYFFSPVCPSCPSARQLISKVCSKRSDVEYVEVNTYTEEGIERGMSLNLMAVPAVAVDGILKLIGWPFDEKALNNCINEAKSCTP